MRRLMILNEKPPVQLHPMKNKYDFAARGAVLTLALTAASALNTTLPAAFGIMATLTASVSTLTGSTLQTVIPRSLTISSCRLANCGT
jgi:hypothetical protein